MVAILNCNLIPAIEASQKSILISYLEKKVKILLLVGDNSNFTFSRSFDLKIENFKVCDYACINPARVENSVSECQTIFRVYLWDVQCLIYNLTVTTGLTCRLDRCLSPVIKCLKFR